MSRRTFALAFGIMFIMLGLGGFVPGIMQMPNPEHPVPIVDQNYGRLLGLFPVNILHDGVHILFGIWGLLSWRSRAAARLYARGVAIGFAALTLAGFVPGLETMFGLMPLFSNDIWLHAILALVGCYFAWIHHDPPLPAAAAVPPAP